MDAFKFHLQKKQLLDLLVRRSRCRKALEKVILAKFPRPPPPPPSLTTPVCKRKRTEGGTSNINPRQTSCSPSPAVTLTAFSL